MSAMSLRTSNPACAGTFDQARGEGGTATMSLQGTVVKSLALVAILMAAAVFTWTQTLANENGKLVVNMIPVQTFMLIGGLGGLVVALITIFVPRVLPFTAPVYAALEGLLLGGASALFERFYPGIVIEAVGLTVGTLVLLLVLYGTGIVKVTQGFRAAVVAATGAIFLVYLISFVLSLFGTGIPFLRGSGLISIGFSLVVVVVAALNLVLDFDVINQNIEMGAPRYMEWYCGFSLLVTLIWLYLEILLLLAKLRGRD